jgi:hypothetical protein
MKASITLQSLFTQDFLNKNPHIVIDDLIDYLEPEFFNPETQKIATIISVNGVATHEVIDLTPKEIAEQENQQKQELKRQAHEELLPTDWYIVRFIERGIEIPEEILQQRQEIRNKYN